MKKVKDTTIVLVLLSILVVLTFWSFSRQPIQNEGIVKFAQYNRDSFTCSPQGLNTNCDTQGDIQAIDPYAQNNFIIEDVASSSDHIGQVDNVQYEQTENMQVTDKSNITQVNTMNFGSFAENLLLPSDAINNKPNFDMREESISAWRKESERNSNLDSNLREYQQQYNEGLDPNEKFKKMSIEEHRKQNIMEWEQRIRKTTNDTLEQKSF